MEASANDPGFESQSNVLIKVHQDLLNIKEHLHSDGQLDIAIIQSAIEKAEIRIKEQNVQSLNHMNGQVRTLPSLQEQTNRDYPVQNTETTWDLQQAKLQTEPAMKAQLRHPRPRRNPDKYNFTPAERVRLQMAQRTMFNPQNEQNRQTLNDFYGLQLPLIGETNKSATKSSQKQLFLGTNVEKLASLPSANRRDPQLAPPCITEDDARHGILSLLERGLIPPGSDLALDPSPVKHRLAQIHEAQDKTQDRVLIATEGTSYSMAGLKLDSSIKDDDSSRVDGLAERLSVNKTVTSDVIARSNNLSSSMQKQSSIYMPRAAVTQKTLELQLHPVPPPATPNIATESKSIQHRFPMQNGRTRESSTEYLAFKQHYCLIWGPIVSAIHALENLLQEYAVPLAFINGDKLADIALEFELEHKPPMSELLAAVVNRDDVEALINKPGQRFIGSNGQTQAAISIQSQFRMYRQRRAYLEYRHRKWAAGVIALTWVMNVKMATMKRQLKVTRLRELENFKHRAKSLALSWHRIKRSKRLIIHLPSLGYAQRVRDTMNDFGTIQNSQMARLCEIKDPNVEVIYVSPVPVNDECMQYYSKLLSLKSAVDSGIVENQADLSERYKIVVPEAIKSFPTHRMCLSTHLKYSPKALKRIRSLIHGRDAYIVCGVPHIDDLSVAEFLNVPILGPEPDVAHLYSSKSGSKRIFQSASAKVPPGEYDIYTFPQLHDSLAQLITDNLEVRTWLFKMDHEFDGRGTAYCHIADHLRCYMWARKECERYGDKWNKKWAQEQVFNKIHSELPLILENHCIPLNRGVYTSWQHFLNSFLSRGGVVEATPPSDSVTCLTVDMLIEPDGRISTLSSADQIHAESPYRCWGLSSPQCSVAPDELNTTCQRIAEACKARGIVGYFALDFCTFISRDGSQELWATDLNLHYNDSNAIQTLVDFMSNGDFNSADHMYSILPPVQEKRRRRRRHQSTDDELPPSPDRYAVYSTKLLHSNLTVVHYSVFFQMCRAHGIGYDVKEKQGTIFTLIDCFNRETMGMLSIGDNLQSALATFARNLSCIHQEISAPNMQGITNFKNAIEDIETILGTTIQNANDVEDEDRCD